MIFLLNFIISIIYFGYRVEKNDMKGILFRKNSNNKICFTPYNFLNLILIPFYKLEYWKFNFLDINFIFIFIISYFCSNLIINLIFQINHI